MTSYRVIDDHKELDNVGSLTHDQIDLHVSGTTFVVISGTVPPLGRILTAGSNISIVDGGPGGSITISSTGGGGTGTPGGSNSQVQFNDSGSFGGKSSFVFEKSTDTLTVTNLSGSLTKLSNGSSYIVAGDGIFVTTGSNGSVRITSAGSFAPAYETRTSWVEDVQGDADGTNTLFYLSHDPYPAAALMLYVNGVLQFQGGDYSLSGNEVNFIYTPNSGSSLLATYPYYVHVNGSSTAWMEVVAGTADGTNVNFTIAHDPYPQTALMLYVNGVLQRQGSSYDYVLSGSTVTTTIPPSPGSTIIASYPY